MLKKKPDFGPKNRLRNLGGTPLPPFTDFFFCKKGITDLGGTPAPPFKDKIRKVVFEVFPKIPYDLSTSQPSTIGYLSTRYLVIFRTYGCPELMVVQILWLSTSYGCPHLMIVRILWLSTSYDCPYLMIVRNSCV